MTYYGFMVCRSVPMGLAFAAFLFAQGTEPKAKALDYPAHAILDQGAIGAEYTVHSFSNGKDLFIAKDYLVVEVAMFPAPGRAFFLEAGQFSLRVNERKQELEAQSAQLVATSLKYPDTAGGLHSTEQLGPVLIGQTHQERFPGDPTVQQRRTPPSPDPGSDRDDAERRPPAAADEVVVQAALPEGECHRPASGFVYFRYRGNISRIHSLELRYRGPAGEATLSLPLQ